VPTPPETLLEEERPFPLGLPIGAAVLAAFVAIAAWLVRARR
jgi:hypothetical protein